MSRTRAFFQFLTAHRWAVLAAYALALAGAAVGVARLRVDYSAEQFFLFDGSERATFDTFKAHFPREDPQVSAFLEVDGPRGVDDFERLRAVAGAFRESGLHSVRWLGSVELVEEGAAALDADPAWDPDGGLDGDPDPDVVTFLRLEDEEGLSDEWLRRLVEARRDHPLFAGVLWGADQRVFAVHGFLEPDENTDARRREITLDLQARLADLTPPSGRLVLNGLPVLRVTIPLALSSDMGRLLGLGILLALTLVWLYFRRVGLALLVLAGVVPAVLLTLGGMGFVGRSVTVLTSSTPIVVLVVGIADAIHLMVGARSRWRGGLAPVPAVVDAFTELARACFFTSLTTALGFAGLMATGIPIVRDFGGTTAVAVMATWAVTMTLLPVLVSFARDFGPESTVLSRLCDGVARGARRTLSLPSGPVLAALGLVLVGGVALGAGLRVQAYLIDDLRDDDPILEELRWLEAAGFGVFQVNVFVRHDEVPGHAPEALRWAEELASFAREDSLVLGSVTLPATIRELGRAAGLAMASPPGAFIEGPSTSGPVAEAPLAEGPFAEAAGADRWSARTTRELLFLAELQGDDAVEDLYLREEGVSQLILPVRDGGSTATGEFFERLEARLRDVPPPGGRAEATGTVKLSQILWDELLGRILPGVALSVFLVWLSLSWMFRSAWMGFLALLPNLLPLAVLAAVFRLGGFDLKPSSALTFSMVFGIVADDTIHMLSALAAQGREGGAGTARRSVEEQLRALFDEVGPALVLSTIVVCAGFGLLMASRFEALFLVGFLTALAGLLALGADLIGVPHLFRTVGLPRASGDGPPSPSRP